MDGGSHVFLVGTDPQTDGIMVRRLPSLMPGHPPWLDMEEVWSREHKGDLACFMTTTRVAAVRDPVHRRIDFYSEGNTQLLAGWAFVAVFAAVTAAYPLYLVRFD